MCIRLIKTVRVDVGCAHPIVYSSSGYHQAMAAGELQKVNKMGSLKFVCVHLSPLIWQDWERHLVSHPNKSLDQYVVQGIKDGFRLGFNYQKHT